jgi:hypothetical protein
MLPLESHHLLFFIMDGDVNLSALSKADNAIDDTKSLAFFMRSWTSLQSSASIKVALQALIMQKFRIVSMIAYFIVF